MNKKENVQTERILAFVKENPKCEVATVIAKTKIAKSTVYNILKNLREAGKLNYTDKLYTLADEPATIKSKATKKPAKTTKTVVKPEIVAETEPEVVKPKIVAETEPVKSTKTVKNVKPDAPDAEGKNFGRDFGKLIFNGQEYRKGKYIHITLYTFILANPKITNAELKKMLDPDQLVRTFGLYRTSAEARKINAGGKQRYHSRRDMNIILGCGTEISVTNQISRDNFPVIIEAYKKAGIITDVEYAMS